MRLLAKGGQNFDLFQRRHAVLRDGFRAHFNREYNLSIPCLFPQIEGMLAEDHAGKRGTPGVNADGYDRRLAFETQEAAVEFNAFLSEVFKGGAPDDAFNRNPVLHGANPNYGNEDWSLVLVLTILEIHFFVHYRENLPVVVE